MLSTLATFAMASVLPCDKSSSPAGMAPTSGGTYDFRSYSIGTTYIAMALASRSRVDLAHASM